MHISCLEMMNILVAIRDWAKTWTGTNVKIHCDNASVVSVLISGKTKDPVLATISRNIFMLCAKFDIYIHVVHIQGKNNTIADVLSRWDNSTTQKSKLHCYLKNPTWLDIYPSHFELDYEI